MSITFEAKLSGTLGKSWIGEITPLQMETEPYEAEISARGPAYIMAASPFQRKNWNAKLSLTICIRIILHREPVRCLLNLNCANIRLVAVK